jgi:beta propeller repeat protein
MGNDMTSMHKRAFFQLMLLANLLWPFSNLGQQQFQGLCAPVKIVIEQELTLERIGFEARLEIGNNDAQELITDLSAVLTFENPALSTNGVNDAASLFFVRAPTLASVNSVSGDGVIAPGTKAVITWFIIPKIAAGGASPDGVRYQVGCRLAGKMRGVTIPPDVMFAFPATISVKPEPQLDIAYFQPRDVQGDDPFTPEVESPIPFTLGVLVKNSGYGTARRVNINSQQPRIVENVNSLLLIAQLIGTRVNDSPLQQNSLLVNLGDILPAQARKGAWDMITSLSGEFLEFKASYSHASELGGLETSIIKSLNAYLIAHEVLNDQAGRDRIKDFLATTDNNPQLIPNALYESEGNILPVNYLTNAAVLGSAGPGGSFQVSLTADKTGWGYLRLNDPGQAKMPIANVVRSDGKILNTNNVWTNIRYSPINNDKLTYLNLFDLVDLQNYTYTVNYGLIADDTTPPVTTMRFAGAVTPSGGKYYVTPQTQMYFTAEDASPVSMVYSKNGGPFFPALPFSLTQEGEYQIVFHATDTFGNVENNQTNVVAVSGNSGLDFIGVSSPSQTIFPSGDALSIRPYSAPLSFQVATNPSQVNAHIELFQGVVGWPTVAGVPSSPTSQSNAVISVGGDFVDLYRYRLNNGVWSAESAVATPLILSNLVAGTNTISVQGRSQYGGYADAAYAVTATWIVDSSAPTTRITGTPSTPTRSRLSVLNVAGAGVTDYRWTFNNGFYRPETNAAAALPISISSATQQLVTISVLGKVGGVYQSTNTPTTVSWEFNPLYGYLQPGLARVRSVTMTNVGADVKYFTWDGRDDGGLAVPPGWYTLRLTLADQLGRTNFAARLIRVGELTAPPTTLADESRGPKSPYARGHWAVWQDQNSGNWEIYARQLGSNLPIAKLTSTTLNQENPRTDGRYVVWQGRQPNGNWDIFLKDLNDAAPPLALTSSLQQDEVNPAIDWPWVVFQRKSSANQAAPWQVFALNLLSHQTFSVWPSPADQLTPDVRSGRVVWQDLRDVGAGEIYFRNLESAEQRRITTNTFGQFNPVINGQWIIWQDGRNGQVDLYGFDRLRNTEVRITSTAENESRPFLDGSWLLCQEDSLGPLTANVRLVHLPSLRSVPVTRTTSLKDRPSLAFGRAVWLDTRSNLASVVSAELPSLQAVFQNRNAVAVTEAMAAYQQNAHTLLTLWQAEAGVQEITHYGSLVPNIVNESAYWTNGAPAGVDFSLTPGDFLWIRFNDQRVVELGVNPAGPLNFAAGVNAFSYTSFPSDYSAFRLLNQLGVNDARAVRMLDSESGRWVVAQIRDGRPIGVDFPIPRVAVLMLDMVNPVNNFNPQ